MSSSGDQRYAVIDLLFELAAGMVIVVILVVTAIPVALHRYRSSLRRARPTCDLVPRPATAERAA